MITLFALRGPNEEFCGRKRNAEWSSQVARRVHSPEVAGSNPVSATIIGKGKKDSLGTNARGTRDHFLPPNDHPTTPLCPGLF